MQFTDGKNKVAMMNKIFIVLAMSLLILNCIRNNILNSFEDPLLPSQPNPRDIDARVINKN